MFLLTFAVQVMLISSAAVAQSCSSYYEIADGCDLTYGNVLETFGNVLSSWHCSARCDRNSECLSVKYNPNDQDCQINAEPHPTLNTNCPTILKYGTLTKSSCRKQINEACTYSVECSVTNSRCHLDTCQCDPGYSYNNTGGTCVTSCVSYGDTFTMYPGYYLVSHNDKIVNNINSGDVCKQLCVDETDFLCRAVDYRNDFEKCFLSTATALSTVKIFKLATDPSTHDHYHRNCLDVAFFVFA